MPRGIKAVFGPPDRKADAGNDRDVVTTSTHGPVRPALARLQSLTRELAAAVAIDDTTFRRAGRETCAAFVRHADLAIRGRAQPATVYALPL